MKKKLFGSRIPCSCSYCSYSGESRGETICTKKKQPKTDGQCRSFCYNPLRRVPRPAPKLPKYTPDEFTL